MGNSAKSNGKTGIRLTLDSQSLQAVFGSSKTTTDKQRIRQRLSKFNSLANSFRVRLFRDRTDGILNVTAPSLEKMLTFHSTLLDHSGAIQRSFANLLGSKLTALNKRGGPETFFESQKESLSSLVFNPLRFFPIISDLLKNTFVSPPFHLRGLELRAKNATEAIQQAVLGTSKSLIVIGLSGIGKTTLLYNSFLGLRPVRAKDGQTLYPVYIPGNAITLKTPENPVAWDLVPGVSNGFRGDLEALYRVGRLILFIDGLDENTRLADFSDPAVWGFWGIASRNRCVLSCRDKFYNRFVLHSPIEKIFNGKLCSLELPIWTAAEAKKLYVEIARKIQDHASTEFLRAVVHLSRLPVETLRNALKPIRLTALSTWAYAVFFAAQNGGKLPRNEYEILDYLIRFMLDWESEKGSKLEPDVALGFLRKMAWKAYLQGNCGESWNVTAEDVTGIIAESYPFYLENKTECFNALKQIPIVSYDGKVGSFSLERHLSEFLIANYFIDAVLLGDREELEVLFRKSLAHNSQVYLFQGLALLGPKEAERYLEVVKNIYQDWELKRRREPKFELEVAMATVLQPLGYLPHPGAMEFLKKTLTETKNPPEFIRQSMAIGFAYGGQAGYLKDYIRRLQKNTAARSFNLSFYLFYVRRYKAKKNIEDFDEKKALQWDAACDWLLTTIPSSDFIALRPLHLFTLWDFALRKGSGPFLEDGATSLDRRDRLEHLIKVLRQDPSIAQDPDYVRFLEDLQKLTQNGGKTKCRK